MWASQIRINVASFYLYEAPRIAQFIEINTRHKMTISEPVAKVWGSFSPVRQFQVAEWDQFGVSVKEHCECG